MIELEIPYGRGDKRREREILFAEQLKRLQQEIGISLSSRGWAYQLEGFGLINKDEFDKAQNAINSLRKKGFLPIDFVAKEQGRQFRGIEVPEEETPLEYLQGYLEYTLKCERGYTPDWWEDEKYYIQMVVEKIDLVSLFESICRKYHIPIATSSGWASMLMRAKYAKRFKEYEDAGYQCVLLYCGDFDPAGLQISEFLRKNLRDLRNIRWKHGGSGYNPKDLIIQRFGLDYEFIIEHNLSWIDNLVTGTGRNLASPSHPHYEYDYVQDYLKKYGARKCEANALVVNQDAAHHLVEDAIEKYYGKDADKRFAKKRKAIIDKVNNFREKTGINETIQEAIEMIEDDESE